MLAIQKSDQVAQKTTPNLLPTSIKHNGPIPTSSRYWAPKLEHDGTSTAYFRGRKLRGRTVKVPERYEGIVLQKSEQLLPTSKQQTNGGALADQLRRMEEGDGFDNEDEMNTTAEAGKEVEVKVMEVNGKFDEIVVWGHEMVPEDEDVYVKGVEEWIGFAETMHSYENTPTE